MDVTALVRDIGFPIFVSVYLLVRLERTLNSLKDTLGGLRNTLTVLNQPWSGVERRRAGGRAPWREAGGS